MRLVMTVIIMSVMVVVIMLMPVMRVVIVDMLAMDVVVVRLVAVLIVRMGRGFVLVMIGLLTVVRLAVFLGLGMLDDPALDAVSVTAAARAAVARTAAARAVLTLFLGLAMGALVGLDQCLTVGDRDLVIVGMDFAEGEEAVAVAAIFDEGGLQRRLYPRDLGEVDIAAQLFAVGGLEIKFFDAIAADHDDPGFFRVGRIDQHLVGHFGTLGGGGRMEPGAREALSVDATVHLIRG
jgi:hypothetical protein